MPNLAIAPILDPLSRSHAYEPATTVATAHRRTVPRPPVSLSHHGERVDVKGVLHVFGDEFLAVRVGDGVDRSFPKTHLRKLKTLDIRPAHDTLADRRAWGSLLETRPGDHGR